MPDKRKKKTKLRISAVEAFAFMARVDAAAKEGNMLNLMMPNGKLLGECTRKDLLEIAKAIEDAAPELDRLKDLF